MHYTRDYSILSLSGVEFLRHLAFRQQQSVHQKLTAIDYTYTKKETAAHYKINISMIYKWINAEDKLRGAKKKALRIGSGKKPFYPIEEKQVVANAIEQRQFGCCVSYASMAAEMRKIVNAAYPESLFKSVADITEKQLGRLQNSLNSSTRVKQCMHTNQVNSRMQLPVFGVHWWRFMANVSPVAMIIKKL